MKNIKWFIVVLSLLTLKINAQTFTAVSEYLEDNQQLPEQAFMIIFSDEGLKKDIYMPELSSEESQLENLIAISFMAVRNDAITTEVAIEDLPSLGSWIEYWTCNPKSKTIRSWLYKTFHKVLSSQSGKSNYWRNSLAMNELDLAGSHERYIPGDLVQEIGIENINNSPYDNSLLISVMDSYGPEAYKKIMEIAILYCNNR